MYFDASLSCSKVIAALHKGPFMFRLAESLVGAILLRYGRAPYDAYKHPSESYYAAGYLTHIRRELEGRGVLRILDAGCGTGRLLVPLAEAGHHLVGIDRHRDSLDKAKENVAAAGVNAEFVEGELLEKLRRYDDGHFDAALAIESLYVNRNYHELVQELSRVVRDGGLMFITHRTRYFLLLQALASGHFDDALYISGNSAGSLRKGYRRVYYNWQTRNQIKSLYKRLHVKLRRLVGIGAWSGFGSDPLAVICDPGALDPTQRDLLHQIESRNDDDVVMASRYVLAVVEKTPPATG